MLTYSQDSIIAGRLPKLAVGPKGTVTVLLAEAIHPSSLALTSS